MFFPDAAQILKVSLQHPKPSLKIEGASIDTRTLEPGNLFVALETAKEDGHRFLSSAFEKGASGALVSQNYLASLKALPENWQNLLPVANTALAFLKLGSEYRKALPLKAAIAVVGSVGKTSTKEFLHYIFSQKSSTLATRGNLNNQLGLPLTLLRLQSSHEYAICELGTDHLGEIKILAEALQPDAGILTQIAAEHLEGFGSLENVYEGEIELFHAMKPGSVAVIPDDDPVLDQKIQNLPLKFIRVGSSSKADYRLGNVKSASGWISFQLNGIEFSFPGLASFLARNASMALALADQCGLKLQDLPSRWENLKFPSGRFESQIIGDGVHVIFDGYNASPASFQAALKTFEEIPATGRKFLIFSDMLELGSEEKKFHEALGFDIAKTKISQVVAYGKRAAWSLEVLKSKNPKMAAAFVENAKEAAHFLQGKLEAGDWVLLKASRSMKIEDVLNYLSGKESVCH